jgi:hypothetical protein
MEVYHRMCEQVASFRRAQVRLEHTTMARLRAARELRTEPYVIKVVVHVVWRTAEQNISDAQINSQMTVLNKDFRATNPDRNKTPLVWKGLVADSMIEFKLDDVIRKPTDRTSFGTDDGIKAAATGGSDPIDTTRFLNVWVGRLRGGLLGYAQFPSGPSKTDGVVILNTAFGTNGIVQPPFDLGRTCTHEVGHFFNLRHIWGDTPDCSGSDFVADTPNAEDANVGKPTFPQISCNNGPDGDMFMNYMDYTDDDSMFMFTTGQVARMLAALEGPRSSLIA